MTERNRMQKTIAIERGNRRETSIMSMIFQKKTRNGKVGSLLVFLLAKDALDDVLISQTVHAHIAFKQDQVDTAAQLVAGEQIELDPAEALRIRRKIDWHILPLMCSKSS